MIKIRNLNVKFHDYVAIENINLDLPKSGLVAICGPSGCGKTTLLNCLSGLIKFSGDIEIDSKYIKQMSEKEMNKFRLKNIGFIFQDFKLYENETCCNNVLFPLETLSALSKESKMRKCKNLLKMVGLNGKEKQIVSSMSGGEKQRTAIARALVNDPKFILADEPTGALDSVTANEILKLLEKISLGALVVMVSHDEELTKKYADEIIYLQDGKIISVEKNIKNNSSKHLLLEKNLYTEKKPTIPKSFLIKHSLQSLKLKKWRTVICSGVTSLGLIGVGLAITLSSSISSNIKKAYSSVISDNKIMISLKDDNSSYGIYGGSFIEAISLKEQHSDFIEDVGVDYIADFENYFKTTNQIAIADTFYYSPIDGISIRNVNEFKWLDVEPPSKIYPNTIKQLNDDEVVMGLSIDMINNICYQLRIERTVTSLSHYLLENDLKFYFDLANEDWQYSDQQIVTLRGFSLEKIPCIYHSNHLWNEYMFEERMRFPTNDNMEQANKLPWVLKKIPYLFLKTENYLFLEYARYLEEFDPYILEIANSTYFPWLYYDTDVSEINRVMFLVNTLSSIPCRYVNYFMQTSDELINPLYGTYGGYSIFPFSMMMGFSNFIYFSFNETSLNEVVDIKTSLNTDASQTYILPSDVLCGHYSQTLSGGVGFSILENNLSLARRPNDINEVVVSTGLLEKLTRSKQLDNNILHIAYTISESYKPDGQVIRDFKNLDLVVLDVIENEKPLIYQNSDWLISFFQCRIGVSSYYLGINTLALDVKNNKNIEKQLQNLSKSFPDYLISSPINEINNSVDKVCFYVEIALSCFSITAVIISTLLLTVSNYLHLIESKKDIGLARCMGVDKKEARKFLHYHSLMLGLYAFILSSIELIFISIIISYIIGDEMGSGFIFSFNPISLIWMFILSFLISMFSSLIIGHYVSKLSPLEALKT